MRGHEPEPWTAEQIRALGVRTDLATACSIVYGVKRVRAWEMYHRGELCFPTLKSARRVWVPVASILRLLQIEPEPAVSEQRSSLESTEVERAQAVPQTANERDSSASTEAA